MASQKIIEFIYGGLQKRLKQLESNVFVLYLPERIKLQPGEFKHVNMKVVACVPEQTVAACVLLPTLSKNGLKLESLQYISTDLQQYLQCQSTCQLTMENTL